MIFQNLADHTVYTHRTVLNPVAGISRHEDEVKHISSILLFLPCTYTYFVPCPEVMRDKIKQSLMANVVSFCFISYGSPLLLLFIMNSDRMLLNTSIRNSLVENEHPGLLCQSGIMQDI